MKRARKRYGDVRFRLRCPLKNDFFLSCTPDYYRHFYILHYIYAYSLNQSPFQLTQRAGDAVLLCTTQRSPDFCPSRNQGHTRRDEKKSEIIRKKSLYPRIICILSYYTDGMYKIEKGKLYKKWLATDFWCGMSPVAWLTYLPFALLSFIL